MITLLSLPDEILLEIFRCVYEEQWALFGGSKVNFGDFRWSKRLRQLAIQAAAEEVSIEIDGDGVLENLLVLWLGNNLAWPYVRHLDVDLLHTEHMPLSTASAATLPATPRTVQLGVEIYASEHEPHFSRLDDRLPVL
jgi:hypothetical protein